ncbi:DUF1398 domain-containing protein [Ancylobacter mangrovi]|uniref:DUF1398 domain-containing protein n=1 Tax=Ancylobacter mangrovi TaxID=2972472 RepID=UPI002161410A|nr:DUF1398 domain-containing protein [Ancylobacter mangrovi]MCS0503085.1 DUF1398 domain-containing protein [Ancylobacter mangrovi]
MNEQQQAVARACLAGAEDGTRSFPEIVGTLAQAGFEGYAVDFRRAVATYYLPDGESLELPARAAGGPVAARFDGAMVQAAIREAQQQAPGYTYGGFCRKAVQAGCAGYVVSFSGRRALYIGRTAETHVEPFPAPPAGAARRAQP